MSLHKSLVHLSLTVLHGGSYGPVHDCERQMDQRYVPAQAPQLHCNLLHASTTSKKPCRGGSWLSLCIPIWI